MVTEYCALGLSNVAALCWPSAEWAAWVQAVGSVVALCLTVWVAAREARRHREMEVQRTRAVQVMGGNAISSVAGFVATITTEMRDRDRCLLVCTAYDHGWAKETADILRAVPLEELHPDLVVYVTRARQSFATFQFALLRVIERVKAGEMEPGTIEMGPFDKEFRSFCTGYFSAAKHIKRDDFRVLEFPDSHEGNG